VIDLRGDTSGCGLECPAFIAKWQTWWLAKSREPLALLECYDGYVAGLSGKSRNMVTKARRLYQFRPIVYNDMLDQIDVVSRSRPIRQGRPMSGWYTRGAQRSTPAQLCAVHRDEWHGAFDADGVLVGFARIEILNEVGILNSLLASAPAAMNGMIAYLVETAGVDWINYLNWESASEGLTDFKRRLGFFAAEVDVRLAI
jgi:hypothetical protein